MANVQLQERLIPQDDKSATTRPADVFDNRTTRKCNDLLFVVLLILFLLGLFIISVLAWSHGSLDIDRAKFKPPSFAAEDYNPVYIKTLIASLCFSILLGVVWVNLIQYARVFIYLTLLLAVLFITGLALSLIISGIGSAAVDTFILGLFLLLCALCLLLWTLLSRKDINFTASLLFEARLGLHANSPAIFIVTILLACAYIGFIAYWSTTALYVLAVPHSTNNGGLEGFHYTIAYLLFALVWMSCLFSAVHQVTIAGSVGTWYFMRNSEQRWSTMRSPAFRFLGRALTSSLGSVAFGSLVLSAVMVVNFIIRRLKERVKDRDHSIVIDMVLACLKCLCSMLQDFVEFIDRFVYIYIAMYGESFCTSARLMVQMFTRRPILTYITDALVGLVLAFGAVCGTALVGLVMAAVSIGLNGEVDRTVLGVSLFAAFFVFYLISTVIWTSVDTVYVCYIEELDRGDAAGAFHLSADLSEHFKTREHRTRAVANLP